MYKGQLQLFGRSTCETPPYLEYMAQLELFTDRTIPASLLSKVFHTHNGSGISFLKRTRQVLLSFTNAAQLGPMSIQKYNFSAAQRYSVWLHHEKRCWFCKEPLGFVEATVDHVIPESLLSEPLQLKKVIDDYDLPTSFQINGYENWLPAHSHCNGTKTNKVFSMTPSYRPIFEQLIQRAAKVKALFANPVGFSILK